MACVSLFPAVLPSLMAPTPGLVFFCLLALSPPTQFHLFLPAEHGRRVGDGFPVLQGEVKAVALPIRS